MPHYKATFVRKYYGHGYDAHMVYLDYTYRGHEYTVEENRAKGNEPLAWQHRSEQNRIEATVYNRVQPWTFVYNSVQTCTSA